MNKKLLIDLSVKQKLSNVKIGEMLGVHNVTIGRWLKKIGIYKPKKTINRYCCICNKNLKKNDRNRRACGTCYIRVFRYKNKHRAIHYKGGCCVNCGYAASMGALQFHHLKSKSFSIGEHLNKPWKTLQKELDKCIILCANCHVEKHSKQNDPKLLKYLKETKWA